MKGRDVETYDTLNDVLVNLFRDINDIEEKAITSYENKDLTSNDMHVIHRKGAVSDGRNTDHLYEQPCKKRLCGAEPQHRGQAGGSYFTF